MAQILTASRINDSGFATGLSTLTPEIASWCIPFNTQAGALTCTYLKPLSFLPNVLITNTSRNDTA